MWMPSRWWPPSAASVASGMVPMPSCSVAPSSTSSAQWWPTARSTSETAGWCDLRDRVVPLHAELDVVDVDEPVPVGAGHVAVHLGDHGARGLDRGAGGVDRDAERAEAVPVGRRDLDERHVERQEARTRKSLGTSERKTGR